MLTKPILPMCPLFVNSFSALAISLSPVYIRFMETEWLTLDDLAAELGLTKRSVRRLVKRCQIPGVRRLSPSSRTGQRKLVWTREQAEEIKRRRIEGFEP